MEERRKRRREILNPLVIFSQGNLITRAPNNKNVEVYAQFTKGNAIFYFVTVKLCWKKYFRDSLCVHAPYVSQVNNRADSDIETMGFSD